MRISRARPFNSECGLFGGGNFAVEDGGDGGRLRADGVRGDRENDACERDACEALILGIAACLWYWCPLAQMPAVDLIEADPEVTQVVDDARRPRFAR